MKYAGVLLWSAGVRWAEKMCKVGLDYYMVELVGGSMSDFLYFKGCLYIKNVRNTILSNTASHLHLQLSGCIYMSC